ncbi:MAG: ABC transporter permease [Caenispirillum sp.]|nr:ABC transporter permease [Caenispirillum sp.]
MRLPVPGPVPAGAALAPLLALPAIIFLAAFFVLPMARVALRVAEGPDGLATYLAVLTNDRYLHSLIQTLVLAAGVTATALVLCGIVGLFLVRHRFPGRSLIVAMLSLPLSFPGTVVGFMVIMLAGRQGVIGDLTAAVGAGRLVFAYGIAGLFAGYLYFSIPRVILAVMAAAETLDRSLEEAARSLGAPGWKVVRDVIVPGLMPALISSGAICFATAMGAFGTAFTLATDIAVLPMTIYTEFTLNANIAVAASLSIALGAITWACLALAGRLAAAPAPAA